MTRWIKENLVLVSGIVLPVILVGGFFILSKAPQLLVDPPTHDFLVVGYRYDYQHQDGYRLSFDVESGKLVGKATELDDSEVNTYRQIATLYRYLGQKQAFKELHFDIPSDIENLDSPAPLDLAVTDQLTLDDSAESPDGFRFELNHGRGRGGLLGEMFGMRSRYESRMLLRKRNAVFPLPKLPDQQNFYNNDLRFMGWIIAEDSVP